MSAVEEQVSGELRCYADAPCNLLSPQMRENRRYPSEEGALENRVAATPRDHPDFVRLLERLAAAHLASTCEASRACVLRQVDHDEPGARIAADNARASARKLRLRCEQVRRDAAGRALALCAAVAP